PHGHRRAADAPAAAPPGSAAQRTARELGAGRSTRCARLRPPRRELPTMTSPPSPTSPSPPAPVGVPPVSSPGGRSARADFDFTRPAFRRDPYPTYRALRESTPLHCIETDRGTRFWVLTRHADVTAVLRDPRMSVERGFPPQPPPLAPGVAPETLHPVVRALRVVSRVMLFRDPPDHTRLRGLVGRAFTPRMVEALRPRITALVAELLAPLADGEPFDVVAQLAEPLPLLVIAELLGLPAEDRADLKRWSDDLA